MAVSNLALVWLDGIAGMSLSLFGLGLGWNLAYVAATTELVALAAPSERGRLVGFSDLALELHRRGARARRRRRLHRRRLGAARAAASRWPRCRRSSPRCRPRATRCCCASSDRACGLLLPSAPGGRRSALSPYEDLQRQARRDHARLVRRRRRGPDPRPPRDADRRPPARQGQAAVHAARRHRRLRRRRQRREDRRHGQRSSTRRCTTATPATRAASRRGRCASSSSAGRRRSSARRSRACSRATGSRASSSTKLKIYAGPEHPHEAQAPKPLEVSR